MIAFLNLLKPIAVPGISVLLFLSCSGKPYVVEAGSETNDTTYITIYIVSHGWHTGIIVPAADIQQQLPPLKDRFKEAVYLEIGWGDRGFYQADEITAGLTVKALFWPTGTVVHVVALPEDIKSYFRNTQSLCLLKTEYNSLTHFLAGSFARDSSHQIFALSRGLYGDSQFYKGTGSYHLFNTCNKWTAKALQSAGMDITPSIKLTADSIMDYLKIETALHPAYNSCL